MLMNESNRRPLTTATPSALLTILGTALSAVCWPVHLRQQVALSGMHVPLFCLLCGPGPGLSGPGRHPAASASGN